MTESQAGPTTHARADSYAEPSGWTGWIFFAGLMMILMGSFGAIQGLVALFNKGYYLVGSNGLVVNVDYTGWGWFHLILGAIVVLTGFGVMVGNTAARVFGIILAVISAIANLLFIAAYPVWSIIVITVDVIIIYALAVHGRELRA